MALSILASTSGIEQRLLAILLQLVVIILAARAFAWLFRELHQPSAVGEIAAGLVLGPSVLGALLPGVSASVFPPPSSPLGGEVGLVFGTLSQLGLILLLFLVGLEFDFSHLRRECRATALIALAGTALPFAFGLALSGFIEARVERPADSRGFRLFLATALSITALPILGRMIQELGFVRTRLAAITITAAAVGDALGWMLLAAVTAVVRAEFDLWASARMLAESVGFCLLLVVAVRPFLGGWVRRAVRGGGGELGLNALAVLLAVLFLCAMATSWIGIFAIFGAFLLGAVLSQEAEFREAVSRQLSRFVTVFFLPIFFTYTGLRTDVGSLESVELWLLAGLVSAAAVGGKFGGCALAARLGGLSSRESLCVGALMNTRALMELIVINVGRDLGVIPPSVFCMLVLMALLTTVMTTPLLTLFARGTEIEGPVRAWAKVGGRSAKGPKAR
jgi:Kef-type K+ transport system membrane component KefB